LSAESGKRGKGIRVRRCLLGVVPFESTAGLVCAPAELTVVSRSCSDRQPVRASHGEAVRTCWIRRLGRANVRWSGIRGFSHWSSRFVLFLSLLGVLTSRDRGRSEPLWPCVPASRCLWEVLQSVGGYYVDHVVHTCGATNVTDLPSALSCVCVGRGLPLRSAS